MKGTQLFMVKRKNKGYCQEYFQGEIDDMPVIFSHEYYVKNGRCSMMKNYPVALVDDIVVVHFKINVKNCWKYSFHHVRSGMLGKIIEIRSDSFIFLEKRFDVIVSPIRIYHNDIAKISKFK